MAYNRILAVALLTIPILFGQHAGDSIEVGSYRLRLGMPRDQVLDLLASSFEIYGMSRSSPCPPDADSCTVWTKATQPPFVLVANVAFKNNLLSTVIKYWDPDDQRQAVPFANSLYGVISSLVKDGKTSCVLNAVQSVSPGGEHKAAFIICGDRKIDIQIVRDHTYGEMANVSEWLSK